MRPSFFVVALGLVLLPACGGTGATTSAPQTRPPSAPVSEAPPPAAELREQSRSATCTARGPLPDSSCTPGAVMPGIDRNTICNAPTRRRRHVTPADHRKAFSEYGYSFPQPRGAFEVDHLIPLELGGDNVIANLWAEPAEPRPGFHEKDKVEDYLHAQVCKHGMSLAQAQREIATNWVAVWKQFESSASSSSVESDDEGEGE